MSIIEAMPDVYRSIFWEDDWAHQKYFGWKLVLNAPGLRILRKKKFFISRFLVLVEQEGNKELEPTIFRLMRSSMFCEIVVHNFDAKKFQSAAILDRHFRSLDQKGRLLNIATMVIDLLPDEGAIISRMSATTRNEIRKAQSLNITVAMYARPDKVLRDSFNRALEKLAVEHQLQSMDPSILDQMYKDGHARLFVARKDEDILSYAHVYQAGDKALFMYGVNPTKNSDGVGSYIQYRVICYLKDLGVRWYDMGGVPSFDPSDGIYNFKKKFGSRPICLGDEYRHRSRVIDVIVSMRECVRNILFAVFKILK